MSRASGPRRAAASAGVAVALAAGAASGLVAADLERSLAVESVAAVAAPPSPDAAFQAPDELSTLTPAPAAPRNARAGHVPHTTTRAS